jgi:hypothetical protein
MNSFQWPQEGLDLLGKAPDSEVALKFGTTAIAAYRKRKSLGIPKFSKNHGIKPAGFWSSERIAELGVKSDHALSVAWSCSTKTIRAKRVALGIRPFVEPAEPWSAEEIALLGKVTDEDVAAAIKRGRSTVRAMRVKLGIPAFVRRRRQQDGFFLGWESFSMLTQSGIFAALKKHYDHIFDADLTYPMLAKESFYSVSRLQKWFSPGSAQQPLNVDKKHHFWLLAMHWGLRGNAGKK